MTPLERLEACHWQTWWVPSGVDVIDRPALCYTRSEVIPPLNQVLRVDAPSGRIGGLVAEFEAAHRHTPSTCWVYEHRRGAVLEAAVQAVGYRSDRSDGEARIVSVEAFQARPPADLVVSVMETLDDCRDGTRVHNAAFGNERVYSDDDYRQMLGLANREGARSVSFLARERATGRPVGYGNLRTFPRIGMGVLSAGSTVPDARGRGVYSAVLAARIAWCRAVGIGLVGLFANVETSAPIVAGLGFARHGCRSMWTREPA